MKVLKIVNLVKKKVLPGIKNFILIFYIGLQPTSLATEAESFLMQCMHTLMDQSMIILKKKKKKKKDKRVTGKSLGQLHTWTIQSIIRS